MYKRDMYLCVSLYFIIIEYLEGVLNCRVVRLKAFGGCFQHKMKKLYFFSGLAEISMPVDSISFTFYTNEGDLDNFTIKVPDIFTKYVFFSFCCC